MTTWGGYVPSVSDIYRAFVGVMVAPHLVASRPNISWSPPTQGIIKINVDESFSGESLASGIRGVFKDHNESILLQFAKQFGADLAIHAEILAIRNGMLIVTAS